MEAESAAAASGYYRKSFRRLIGIVLGAIVFIALSPSGIAASSATFFLILVPILWGIGIPERTKHKAYVYLSGLALSALLYLFAVM